jgi:hypothetical protein
MQPRCLVALLALILAFHTCTVNAAPDPSASYGIGKISGEVWYRKEMTKAMNMVFAKARITLVDVASAKYTINVHLEMCNMHPNRMRVVGTGFILTQNGQKLETIPFDVGQGDPFEKAAQVIAYAIQKDTTHENLARSGRISNAKLTTGADIKNAVYHGTLEPNASYGIGKFSDEV